MKTTELFVELIVIGIGASTSFIIFILTFFDYNSKLVEEIPSALALILFFSLTYLIGILIDRFADFCFQKWDKIIRNSLLNFDVDYQQVRTMVYEKSESLKDWFYYGRGRLRICRGWAINSILLFFSSNYFLLHKFELNCDTRQIIWFSTIFFILIFSGCVFSWYRFTVSEYKRLRQEYFFNFSKSKFT